MVKVILWGSYAEYGMFYKHLHVEVLKGNMQIAAVVLNGDHLMSRIDGIEVIKVEELLIREYDYLIDMNRTGRDVIIRLLELLQVPKSKVIPAKIFLHPYFDLQRWQAVKESRISIISNSCWGGITYHSLGLEFLSPFINLFLDSDDYLRLLENFTYYMEQPLSFIEERYEVNLKRNYPVIALDDVTLFFNHYTDFESAVGIWEKRKLRLNRGNLLVEMKIESSQELDRFLALPFEHKIGFSTVPCEAKDILYFPILENGHLQNKYAGIFGYFLNEIAAVESRDGKPYDVLKLLNHEEDYARVTYGRQ